MLIALALACSPEAPYFAVRATLDDDQVLVGEVTTETLQLVTGMGTVDVPLDDIGEVAPVEGGALESSGGHVFVWLRNGSELRGRWAEPALSMSIDVGGELVSVDLPTADLERFQLQGGDLMPEGVVYRARTVFGDDLLVDAERSRFGIENELGTFLPFLSECVSIEPLDGGGWRVELVGGTVLIGESTADELELALPLGPELVSLDLDDLVSLERQTWSGYEHYRPAPTPVEPAEQDVRPEVSVEGGDGPARAPAAARPADTGGEGWFDNRRQLQYKLTY